jgi:pilus assembly protein CpaB
MRAKSMALLMLALGCGLVAAIGITQVMAKRNVEPPPTGETQQVLISLQDIPFGEHLAPEFLKLEPWPKDKVPPGTISKIEDVDGCRTRAKIYAGEPILEKKLFSKGTSQQGDSSRIPKGLRVVSVKVDNVSGGPGLIVPGDRVDVLVHLMRSTQGDIQETSTRTILQDIKVFAVNDVVDLERDKDSANKDKERMAAKTISLLVTPAQAAKLTLASEMGKIRLIMRSIEDPSNSVDGNADPSQLFGDSIKADRDKETLVEPDKPAPSKNLALENLLENMKKPPKAEVKPVVSVTPNEIWKTRILKNNGIDEVEMEFDSSPEAAKMPQGPWRINGTNTISIGGGPNTNNNRPQTLPAAVPASSPAPEPQAGLPPSDPPGDANANPSENPAPPSANPPAANPAPSPSGGSEEGSEGKE